MQIVWTTGWVEPGDKGMVTIIPYQQLLTLGWVSDDAIGEGQGVQAAHVLVEPDSLN